MRLIDADVVLKALGIFNDREHGDPHFLNGIETARKIVEQAQTIGGWVKLNDKPPEGQEPVIVYVPPYSDDDEEYVGHVAVAYYTQIGSGGYWAGTDGNVYGAIGIIHEPTHWMPLPEPPKEDDGDA